MIRNHVNDLKEQHMQEMSSCKSQFEADIKNAIERTKMQQSEVEPVQDFAMPQQSYEIEPGDQFNCIISSYCCVQVT